MSIYLIRRNNRVEKLEKRRKHTVSLSCFNLAFQKSAYVFFHCPCHFFSLFSFSPGMRHRLENRRETSLFRAKGKGRLMDEKTWNSSRDKGRFFKTTTEKDGVHI